MQSDFVISEETAKELIRFRDARGWEKFHTPGNLAKSIMIEGAELLEHYQWNPPGNFKPMDVEAIHEEVADIAIYLFYFCHALRIDLDGIVLDKITKNSNKYPS